MTKSFLHPKEHRPVNKATMDAPQEEFVDDQNPPSKEETGDVAARRTPEPKVRPATKRSEE